MGEGIRYHIAARLLLQAIVADRRRRLQRGFHISRLDRIPALIRMMRPYAGETVGLQLDPHLDAVGLYLAADGPIAACAKPQPPCSDPENSRKRGARYCRPPS